MRKIAIVICLIIIIGSIFAEGRKETPFISRKIEETRDVDRKGKINIDNIAGSVKIKSWNKNKVMVKGQIGKDVKELIFTNRGMTTTIKVVLPKKPWKWNVNAESFLEITVPAANSLNINTVSASIEIEGVKGEIEAGSVSGEIELLDIDSDYLALKTVSGRIAVNGNAKNLEASTVSGAITIKGTIDELRSTSVSGSLSYKDGIADIVNMKTTSGQIYVNCDVEEKARIDLNSLSGNVNLVIPANTDARFSLKSFSGSLDYINFVRESDFNTNNIESKKNGNKKINFTTGKGRSRINAESFSGSVILEAK